MYLPGAPGALHVSRCSWLCAMKEEGFIDLPDVPGALHVFRDSRLHPARSNALTPEEGGHDILVKLLGQRSSDKPDLHLLLLPGAVASHLFLPLASPGAH